MIRPPIQSLADYDELSFAAELRERGHNASHAKNILRRFYFDFPSFDPASDDWSKALRRDLAASPLRCSRVVDRRVSRDGTVKLLIAFEDDRLTEAVMMPAVRDDRAAGCVSSQVGCAMGCAFCASTRGGLKRDLTAGEIVEQYLHIAAEARATGRRLASLVFMGMGEPMHNLDAVMTAIRRITEPGIGTLGKRHITVSTVGIVPGIERLAASGLDVYLALSLHAPDDATRAKLVPMNRRHGVSEIVAAARRYQEMTGRIVIIEYCLLADVNDTDEHARMLTELLHGFRAHVNLIPYNAIDGVDFRKPAPERVDRFLKLIRQGNVAHVRRTRGDEVAAACGQLAGERRGFALPVAQASRL